MAVKDRMKCKSRAWKVDLDGSTEDLGTYIPWSILEQFISPSGRLMRRIDERSAIQMEVRESDKPKIRD